jgi:hypothetical protein
VVVLGRVVVEARWWAVGGHQKKVSLRDEWGILFYNRMFEQGNKVVYVESSFLDCISFIPMTTLLEVS